MARISKRWRAAALAAAMVAAGGSAAPPARASEPLADYAWRARPFLLFADHADSLKLAAQRRALAAHRAALAERKVPVIEVADGRVRVDGAPSDQSAPALRARYRAPRGAFTAVLIGKDTGVKLRSERPVSADALFGLIDAMPMRRRELRDDAES